MIDLPEETFWQNAALAGTYGERNNPWEYRSWNQKQRGILGQRKIIHHHILLGFFQEPPELVNDSEPAKEMSDPQCLVELYSSSPVA